MGRPKTQKQVRGFVGMVNYYRSFWRKRSLLLAPLTAMTGKEKKFVWESKHDKAFQDVKNMVAEDTMLVHPKFDEVFILHTDASNY